MSLQLSRATVVAAATALLILPLIGYMIGHQKGRGAVLAEQRAYTQLIEPLSRIQEEPPRSMVPTAGPPLTVPGQHEAERGEPSDPREPGLNYFRLATIPASGRGEGERAVTFLRANGVDATLVPLNNGRSFKLVALRGFARPLSDPEAHRFAQRLRSLGREWQAQHRGSSDWRDLIPERYRPGEN